jgi:hypothetical protein
MGLGRLGTIHRHIWSSIVIWGTWRIAEVGVCRAVCCLVHIALSLHEGVSMLALYASCHTQCYHFIPAPVLVQVSRFLRLRAPNERQFRGQTCKTPETQILFRAPIGWHTGIGVKYSTHCASIIGMCAWCCNHTRIVPASITLSWRGGCLVQPCRH